MFRLGSAAAVVAALAGTAFAQQPDPLSRIAAENAVLSAQIAEDAKALERVTAELEALRKAKREVDERMDGIARRAKVHALGREFAETLIERRRELPAPERFAAGREARARLLEATSDGLLRTERALAALGDFDAAAARRLAAARPPVPESQRRPVELAVRERLAEQRDLLARLGELQQKLLQALRDADEAEGDLLRRSQAASAELTRLLFWIPARPGTQTVTEIAPSLAWTLSPTNWRSAAAALGGELKRGPFWPALAVLVAVALYALRSRLQRGLGSLSPAVVTHERYGVGYALVSLAITFALALPGALLLWTAGRLLGAAPDSEAFAQALGDALVRVALLVLAVSAFARLLDRGGMAVGHFGWDEAAMGFTARALRRFVALFVPLLLIAALNAGHHAPYANRQSLGRFAFILAMIAFAAFLVYLLRRRSPLIERLFASAPRSWAVRLYGLWRAALVALPLGIAVLAAAGYSAAAGHFFGHTVRSLFLVLGAVLLYGLIALWVQVQRSHLARRRDVQAGPARQAGSAISAGLQLDVAALGEQTRSLLELFIMLLLLTGMWWVWQDTLPVLSVIGDYALWTYTETVGDKQVTHPLTVGGLFLAILIGVVTAVAVRNVGALLDIVLLQRLEMQADATYAFKVVTRYALATAGIVAAAGILGIGWSDVQWLVAALSVGLGFGLYEIFSNFVAGLIMLAERPVRIGDVVTVGDVSGTVARIRARSTTVVDFDNKEVLIPNKSFITDRVVNWTLSSRITRLVLKVGVARDSDIALVQRVMVEAVRSNPDVVREPGPSAFFTGFGPASLDFEIHAFVDSFDKRPLAQHEINLAVSRALLDNGIRIA